MDVDVVASTGGARIALGDLGGRGRPTLLAHATGFCGEAWSPVAGALTAHRCWALDFRGHGRSVAPEGSTYSWDRFADDVLAVVDHLVESDLAGSPSAPGQIVGIGHSKGGASLLLAEQRRPGTFAGLWVYEPIVMPPDVAQVAGGHNPLAEGALRRRPTFASREEALANFSAKPPMDAFDPAALEAYVDGGFETEPDGTLRLRCRPEVESQVYRMGSKHHAWDHLDELHLPVTVARGAPSAFGPAAFADRVASRIPGAELAPFDHLGHFGPLESPAEIASAIEHWSVELPAPA